MYTDVYPIKRLPRRLSGFTYNIPDNLSSRAISRGFFVSIPWRNQTIRGIVANTHNNKPTYKTKDIIKIEETSLSSDELSVYEQIAKDTFQSPSTVLESSFPKPRKNKASKKKTPTVQTPINTSIQASEITFLKNCASSKATVQFCQTTDLVQTAILARFVWKQTGKPTLFLLPHQHDLDIVLRISAQWDDNVVSVTSALTQPQRADIADEWSKGSIPFLITTRVGATFLPPKNLGAIIIARSGIVEHAQYDRNPRYDARVFALAWGKLRNASVYLTDTSPRCFDALQADSISLQQLELDNKTTIVSLKEAMQFSSNPLLPEQLEQAIDDCLQKKQKVLIFCNQKGLAARVSCKNCDFTEKCGTCEKPLSVYESHLFCSTCKRMTAKPLRCRKCNSDKLILKRQGTRSLKQLLEDRWPEADFDLVEKGVEKLDP
ncbi:MAG: hypothetical protein O2877_02625, partial [bacterium]|nr:hypothetical protein [bacterium]